MFEGVVGVQAECGKKLGNRWRILRVVCSYVGVRVGCWYVCGSCPVLIVVI